MEGKYKITRQAMLEKRKASNSRTLRGRDANREAPFFLKSPPHALNYKRDVCLDDSQPTRQDMLALSSISSITLYEHADYSWLDTSWSQKCEWIGGANSDYRWLIPIYIIYTDTPKPAITVRILNHAGTFSRIFSPVTASQGRNCSSDSHVTGPVKHGTGLISEIGRRKKSKAYKMEHQGDKAQNKRTDIQQKRRPKFLSSKK